MDRFTKNDFFVYQDWTHEELYASGLTYQEALDAQSTLDNLIERGYCGSGAACIGQVSYSEDKYVAQRLGLLDLSDN